ncbi:MAG: bifunctional folylpolyglutamate synthase/dihydrofolate synthase [Clostridia bacterium]|nr:bifunctional folylpolyglutamate synthase/dihydrofolate synthase [Clostridia bacterium]
MNYAKALEFIHSTYKFGSKLGLENIKTLLEALGNPQNELRFVHVAGTNGKGSTSSMISHILMESGYKTGLYTSPFIEQFNERMRIDNVYISDEEIGELAEMVKEKIDWMLSKGYNHPTEFEVVTALGMLYFSKHKCDVVVLEVGLGGRLDATNAIEKPMVSVITPIDMDHIEYLGDTIEKIAYEKAGIIKMDGITIVHPQLKGAETVISDVCSIQNNKLIHVDFETLLVIETDLNHLVFEYKGNRYELGLIAPYQAQNAAVAIETINALKAYHGFEVSPESLTDGLRKTTWLARMEVISRNPLVIIDGAHNVHGIKGLGVSLSTLKANYHVIGIMGVLADKDVEAMLHEILPYLDEVITTAPDNPRALHANDLAQRIVSVPVIGAFENIEKAVDFGLQTMGKVEKDTLLVVFGSLYMVGAARKRILNLL